MEQIVLRAKGGLGKKAVWCVDGALTTASWRGEWKTVLAVYLPPFERNKK